MSLSLITDRTQANVNALYELNAKGIANWTQAEKDLYLSNLKGAYNATDLNRVADACAYLCGIFSALGYEVGGYAPLKNDWTISDIPTQAQMQSYISTVAALKAALSAVQDIPQTMERLTFDGANNIEKLLLEVESQLQRLSAIFIRSGAWNAVAGLTIYAAN